MAIMDINWQTFLNPDSDVPPDVFFQVISEDGENLDTPGRSIGAHRLLLAGVSPVFRGMLLGCMKETRDVIKVKETSYEAFSTMLSFIYKVPGEEFSLAEIRCPQKLFELLTVADKYQILSLKTLTLDTLGCLQISHENIIFAATVAKNYKPLFEDVSKELLLKCFNFISTGGGCDTLTLISETKKNFPDASLDVLYELLNVGNEALQLPGWGNLVFSDTEEHQISDNGHFASIPKLSAQWKISFDLKPTEYPPVVYYTGLWVLSSSNLERLEFLISFSNSNISLLVLNHGNTVVDLKSTQLPKLDEWSRIEISHLEEEEGGNYFLSFSVGGKELGREGFEMGRNMTDVNIGCIGPLAFKQTGFIKELVVSDKQ